MVNRKSLTADNDHISWKTAWNDDYNGPSGGPKADPTNFAINLGRDASSVGDVFFGIFLPLQTFHDIHDFTHKYCYIDTRAN